MSLRHHIALLPLCLGLIGTSPALLAAGATAPKNLPRPPSGPTAVLSQSSPSGNARVTVDGAGNFSQAWVYTSADDASYSMSYASNLLFDGVSYDVDNVQQRRDNRAKSSFMAGSLQVELQQELSVGALAGSYQLMQVYTLANPGTEPVSVNLMRYNDSDIGDFGYQPPGGRLSYILSNPTPSPELLTRYVGVKLIGGSKTTRVVRICCVNFTDITPEENNTVPNDADGDGLSDDLADMAINNQTAVVVPAGGSVKIHTTTLFGRSALDGLSALPFH